MKAKRSENELISVKFTEEWADIASFEGETCLYIGKSTNIAGRISKHIKLGTKDIWKKTDGSIIAKNRGTKPNSASQLRIGLERIFDCNSQNFNEFIDKVDISWIVLDK